MAEEVRRWWPAAYGWSVLAVAAAAGCGVMVVVCADGLTGLLAGAGAVVVLSAGVDGLGTARRWRAGDQRGTARLAAVWGVCCAGLTLASIAVVTLTGHQMAAGVLFLAALGHAALVAVTGRCAVPDGVIPGGPPVPSGLPVEDHLVSGTGGLVRAVAGLYPVVVVVVSFVSPYGAIEALYLWPISLPLAVGGFRAAWLGARHGRVNGLHGVAAVAAVQAFGWAVAAAHTSPHVALGWELYADAAYYAATSAAIAALVTTARKDGLVERHPIRARYAWQHTPPTPPRPVTGVNDRARP